MSVGEEVVVGRPWVVTSWVMTALTPAVPPPLGVTSSRKVEKLATCCL